MSAKKKRLNILLSKTVETVVNLFMYLCFFERSAHEIHDLKLIVQLSCCIVLK